jgi:hypothetical protein
MRIFRFRFKRLMMSRYKVIQSYFRCGSGVSRHVPSLMYRFDPIPKVCTSRSMVALSLVSPLQQQRNSAILTAHLDRTAQIKAIRSTHSFLIPSKAVQSTQKERADLRYSSQAPKHPIAKPRDTFLEKNRIGKIGLKILRTIHRKRHLSRKKHKRSTCLRIAKMRPAILARGISPFGTRSSETQPREQDVDVQDIFFSCSWY